MSAFGVPRKDAARSCQIARASSTEAFESRGAGMNMRFFTVETLAGATTAQTWLQGAVFRRQKLFQPVALLHASLKKEL